MYELVISGGDSFTFGAELPTDNSVNPNPSSWANLVAQRIGKQHVNVARSGRSNSYISRHVHHQLQLAFENNIGPEEIFVQVMWTFVNRNEFAIGIPTVEYDSPWLFLTTFSHLDETESDWFKKTDQSLPNWKYVFEQLKSNYNRNRDLGIVDFAKNYNKLVQSQPLNDSYTSIKEVIHLQNTLLLHKVSFLFTYVNQHVTQGLFHDADKNPGSQYLNSLRKFVKHKNWYSFPGNFQKYIGFDDWAKHNNYKYATSHPLELAHADAADLIYHHLVKNNDK